MNLSATLNFEQFWLWLREHNDCIVRAGTRSAWLYDHDDLHWHLREEASGRRYVQLLRGKQLIAEFAFTQTDALYIEMVPSSETEGHFEFQFFSSTGGQLEPRYVFVMAHAYEEQPAHHQATH